VRERGGRLDRGVDLLFEADRLRSAPFLHPSLNFILFLILSPFLDSHLYLQIRLEFLLHSSIMGAGNLWLVLSLCLYFLGIHAQDGSTDPYTCSASSPCSIGCCSNTGVSQLREDLNEELRK
jgi:hypothetical protein